MSRIINPNMPPRRDGKSALDQVLNTMRIIAQYRTSFFDLEAAKQCDGVLPPLTATQICKVEEVQQRLMRDMVEFILYGADRNDSNASYSERIAETLKEATQNNAPQPQKLIDTTSTRDTK